MSAQTTRSDEFLRFLRIRDRQTGKDLAVHVIAHIYAKDKHPNVKDWLEQHPRFQLRFTPTSAFWRNLVEPFFNDITGESIRRSVDELKAAMMEYQEHHDSHLKPYHWTARPGGVLATVAIAK